MSQPVWPEALRTIMATSRKLGMTMRVSSRNMPIFSPQPREYAMAVPAMAAMMVVMIEKEIPMMSERPKPCTTQANRSKPPPSVPNQCSADGASPRAVKSGSV